MYTYCGVGSRKTPTLIRAMMISLARELAEDGWTLRSGHAEGADQAFEDGADGLAEIYLPWNGFNSHIKPKGEVFEKPADKAWEIASQFHPAWHALGYGGKALHARNVHQVLGPDLNNPDPVHFLICWTEDGEASGGTGQALRIAEAYDVQIYNLYRNTDVEIMEEWLRDRQIEVP